MESTASTLNTEECSNFQKRKSQLESIINDLEKEGFIENINHNISSIDKSIGQKNLIQKSLLEELKKSCIKISDIQEEYNDLFSFVIINGISNNDLDDYKNGIANLFKRARNHTEAKIKEYINDYAAKEVDSEDKLIILDKEESEINYLCDLARLLRIGNANKALNSLLQSVYSRRQEFFKKLDEKKDYSLDQTIDFVKDYSLRIRKAQNNYVLEVIKKDGASALRQQSGENISDDPKVIKEFIDKLEKLDPCLDHDYITQRFLESMIKVRELIDINKEKEKSSRKSTLNISSSEGLKALGLAKDNSLLYKAKTSLDIKIAGEDNLKLAHYIIAMGSRFASDCQLPQGLFVRSLSGSGKTYVAKNVLKLIPDENVFRIVDTTDKVLKYFNEDLWNKVLFIEEWTKLSDGVAKILRQLLTGSGSDSEAWTTEREGNGFITKRKKMNGTPAFITATTLNTIDDQLSNRCWLMYTDISSAQTKKILDFQGSSGIIEKRTEKQFNIQAEEFKNLFIILQQKGVINPFSGITQQFLDGTYVADRRQNSKLENFIDTISLMHQYQRPKVEIDGETYIVAKLADFYMGLRILEPFLRLSFSRIKHFSQTAYQAIRGISTQEKGATIYDIKQSKLLEDKDSKNSRVDEDYLKECIQELKKHGFLETRNGEYFPIDAKFELDGIEIQKSRLEESLIKGFGDKLDQFERCGFICANGEFQWNYYKETLIDPLDGSAKNIFLDNIGKDKLRVRIK